MALNLLVGSCQQPWGHAPALASYPGALETVGKPGTQINTGRPEDEDGEALLHSVTHARQCRRPDTCLGIWDPSEGPSTPEIGLSSRQTRCKASGGEYSERTMRLPRRLLPLSLSLSWAWAFRWKTLEGYCSGHPESLMLQGLTSP